MTADPAPWGDGPAAEEVYPSWLIPPPEGFCAEDLDRLENLPAHTELIDGGLVFVSPQMMFHMRVLRLLEGALCRQVPEHLVVLREMTVTLGKRQRPEPDIMVVQITAYTGLEQTSCRPEDVVLAVEVVSRESEERDRKRKPQLYAQAGIPHFWRVENVDGRAVAYVYELDPATKKYVVVGIFHDQLQVEYPFDIDIDLTKATARRA